MNSFSITQVLTKIYTERGSIVLVLSGWTETEHSMPTV